MSDIAVQLAYGPTRLTVQIPEANFLGSVTPFQMPLEAVDEKDLLQKALAQPVGTPPLSKLAQAKQSVAIITSDLTRPCPSERLLPFIVDELGQAGVPDRAITVITALGLHRPMTEAELKIAVGPEMYRRLRVVNHDVENCVRLGVTSRGTPVEIFREVVEADLRICLGNLEFHWFAGYSGGAKAIMPGCASKASITANHAMMNRPEATSGNLGNNPVRSDIEEVGSMVGIDFILNVIVDEAHTIIGAVAGDGVEAHRRGCALIAERGLFPITEQADIVLLSGGGHPKDINLYQAHKALEAGARAVRPGGIIILAAECGEDFGNQTFESWTRQSDSPDEILARIRQEFVLGGHKAAAIAAIQKEAQIFLVSTMSPDILEQCRFRPFPDLNQALAAAMAEKGTHAKILAIPTGGAMLPVVQR